MSYKGRCMRSELRRCLKELLCSASTDVWKEASAWGKGYGVNFRMDSLSANLLVSLSHVDDEDETKEYVTTIHTLSRVIKTLWREIRDAQEIIDSNRRFWRSVNKLSR